MESISINVRAATDEEVAALAGEVPADVPVKGALADWAFVSFGFGARRQVALFGRFGDRPNWLTSALTAVETAPDGTVRVRTRNSVYAVQGPPRRGELPIAALTMSVLEDLGVARLAAMPTGAMPRA